MKSNDPPKKTMFAKYHPDNQQKFPPIPNSTPSMEIINQLNEKKPNEKEEISQDCSDRSIFVQGPPLFKTLVCSPFGTENKLKVEQTSKKSIDKVEQTSKKSIDKVEQTSKKSIDKVEQTSKKSIDYPYLRTCFSPGLNANHTKMPGSPSKRMKSFLKEKRKTFYDVITNFYLAKKFIRLLQMTTIRKPRFLGDVHFNLIGDLSFDINVFRQINLKESFQKLNSKSNTFFRFHEAIRTFEPFSKFIFRWNLIHLLIFSFLFIIIPVNLCFEATLIENEMKVPNEVTYLMEYGVTLFYLIDIYLNFHIAYYDNGELISDKGRISRNYMKIQFYFDLCSMIIMLIWLLTPSNVFLLLYFVKIFKIKRIFDNIEELLVVNEDYFHVYSLFILLIRIFVVSHIAACIWHLLGISFDDSWLRIHPYLRTSSWVVQYLYSIYFIIITMNTVGYGDISPQNCAEVLFCIFFVIIGCMMFAYTLNCMGNIFHSLYKKEREFKEELFIINSFMRSKNIPQNLQIKIRKYLEYMRNSQKQENLENAKIVFNKLSQSLKNELLLEANGSIVKKIEVFSSNFSQNTLNSMVNIMKEENFSPGEVIFNPGDHKNHDLFFIKKGSVEIFMENELNLKPMKTLTKGGIFGEIAFFSEMNRSAGARSKEFTHLIRFDQMKFKESIEENDEDKEKFHHIGDLIKFYNIYDGLFLRCYSCNQRNHLIRECPLLHRFFFKEVFLNKYNYSINQIRNPWIRNSKRHRADYKLIKGKDVKIGNNIHVISKIMEIKKEDFICESEMSESEIENESCFTKSKNQWNETSEMIAEETESKSSCETKIKNPDLKIESPEEEKKNYTSTNIECKTGIDFDTSLYFDFDKSYTKYFPMNNMDVTISQANRRIFAKLKKLKKSHLFNLKNFTEMTKNNNRRNDLKAPEDWKQVFQREAKKNKINKIDKSWNVKKMFSYISKMLGKKVVKSTILERKERLRSTILENMT